LATSSVEVIGVRDIFLMEINRTNRILLRTLEDLSADELQRSPVSGLSPVIWQVGHVAATDAYFARMCGADVTLLEEFTGLFGRNSGGAKPYPGLADVKPVYEMGQQTLEALSQSAEMGRAIESKNFKTVADALSFNCFHRGYHIGKICTLRALMGRQPLFN
jgi:hypothetical protein